MNCEVAVVGAGAWGTALAQMLSSDGREVLLWAREPELVAQINDERRNGLFLPSAELHPTIRATGNLADLAQAPILLMVTPAQPIMAALSVHSFGGGATSGSPAKAASCSSAARNAALAATPPATTSAVTGLQAPSAMRVRSVTQSSAACWNEAAMSASANVPACLARITALFSPAKEKCGSPLPTSGRGRGTAFGLPSRASRSTAGPPG